MKIKDIQSAQKIEEQTFKLMAEIMQYKHHFPFADWKHWIKFKWMQLRRLKQQTYGYDIRTDETAWVITIRCWDVLNSLEYMVGEFYNVIIQIPLVDDTFIPWKYYHNSRNHHLY